MAIDMRLTEHDPDRVQYQLELCYVLTWLADTYAITGQVERACKLFRSADACARKLQERQPANAAIEPLLSFISQQLQQHCGGE